MEGGADGRRAGIHQQQFAGFGILEFDQPDIGQIALARVIDRAGDDIVMARRHPQLPLVPRCLEVAHQEDHRLPLLNPVQEPQRGGDVGLLPRLLAGEHLAHQPHDGGPALARRNEFHDPVAEEHQPDLVLVTDRRHGEQTGHLRRQLAFGARPRTETVRSRNIDEENDRQFTLFGEALDVRLARPGRHIPVDRPDVIARHVWPHLIELDPLSLENRVVVTGQAFVNQAVGQNADLPHRFH